MRASSDVGETFWGTMLNGFTMPSKAFPVKHRQRFWWKENSQIHNSQETKSA